MEYQNVTLSLPKELVKRAKHIAVERGTSLSGLLAQILEELTRREDRYLKAKECHLAILGQFDLGTEGSVTWTRSDLHER